MANNQLISSSGYAFSFEMLCMAKGKAKATRQGGARVKRVSLVREAAGEPREVHAKEGWGSVGCHVNLPMSF
ncbi:hypothetical protein CCACVL1_12894 [Corchorus capsularis]|uniref:Uncharacterized protein n=1 Tax=Corchorus capsularis TaxID=210143 RepID=A0A1R3IDG2_COCAP|nr:hypothetical protein CCACVL1_12894 [Corchorus capsularis]